MGKDLKGKELGTGICQKENGVYLARFTDRYGKRVCIYDYSLREVKRKFTAAKYKDEKGMSVRSEKIKLDDWFNEWLTVYKDLVRDSSKRIYKHNYDYHISPVFGKCELGKITQREVQKFLNDLKNEKKLSYETRDKIRTILKDMFNKAMENGFVIQNPVNGTLLGKKVRNRVSILSREEQYEFLQCSAGTFYGNAIEVQLETGIRPGELYGLKFKDLDFENRIIHIERTLSYEKRIEDSKKTFHFGPPKTECSIRNIHMSDDCCTALKRQLVQKKIVMFKTKKNIPEEFRDLVFSSSTGMPMNTQIYTDAIDKIVDEINLRRIENDELENVSPHTFRHTYATRYFENGVSPKVIQEAMGHANLEMTMNLYVHVLDLFKISESNKMEGLRDKLDMECNEILEKKFAEIDKYDTEWD